MLEIFMALMMRMFTQSLALAEASFLYGRFLHFEESPFPRAKHSLALTAYGSFRSALYFACSAFRGRLLDRSCLHSQNLVDWPIYQVGLC